MLRNPARPTRPSGALYTRVRRADGSIGSAARARAIPWPTSTSRRPQTTNDQRRHCWPLVVDLYAPNCSRPSRSHERHDEQFFLESRVTCVTQFYSQSVCRDRGRVSVSQEGKTSSMVGRSAVWSFNTTSLYLAKRVALAKKE